MAGVGLHDFPGRRLLAWLLPLPLAIPTYIAAYVYADLFEPLGRCNRPRARSSVGAARRITALPNVRSMPGAIVVMGLVLYPYVYLAARTIFQIQSASNDRSARAHPRHGIVGLMFARRVALPLARPARWRSGCRSLCSRRSNDIGASEYLGVRTLTVSIFTTWLNRGSLPGAPQIAYVLLAAIVALMALEPPWPPQPPLHVSTRRPGVVPLIALAGWAGWPASAACFIPVALGFLIPAGFLIREVIARRLLVGFDPALALHTLTTVLLAAAATAIVLCARVGRRHRRAPAPRPLLSRRAW